MAELVPVVAQDLEPEKGYFWGLPRSFDVFEVSSYDLSVEMGFALRRGGCKLGIKEHHDKRQDIVDVTQACLIKAVCVAKCRNKKSLTARHKNHTNFKFFSSQGSWYLLLTMADTRKMNKIGDAQELNNISIH